MKEPAPILPCLPPKHKRFKNLVGLVFDRLTVMALAGKRGRHHYWRCCCLCGSEAIVETSNLAQDHTRSCGCRLKETTASIGRNNKTHGMWLSPEWSAWVNLRSRCTNPSDVNWSNYGGRGIGFCAKWDKFANFFEDMGKRPSSHHSIDRIDNNKNYSKENCRWATQREQNQNRRNNRKIPFNGEQVCIYELSRRLGLPRYTLSNRLRDGWSLERAITEPLHEDKRHNLRT